MFDAGDWNDSPEAQTLTQSLVATQKRKETKSEQEKSTVSRRKRHKRNRQLLEILQTLKTPSDQNQDLPPPQLEDVPPPGKKKKKKKVTTDVDAKPSSTPNTEAPPPDSGTRLNRKQWKNKMKNKRKQQNKFKPCVETPKKTVDFREEGEPRTGGDQKDKSSDQGGKGKKSKINKVGQAIASKETQQPGNVKRKRKKTDTSEENSTHQNAGEKVSGKKKKTSGDGKGDQAAPRVTAIDKARLAKLKKLLKKEGAGEKKDIAADDKPEEVIDPDDSLPPEEEETDRSTSLRSRMEQRLHSARFRYINEQLYTSESRDAMQLFQDDPEAFTVYHTGFSQQVQRWPVNPLTEIIKYIKNRPSSLVVADFGCGDAQLARSVRNQVHSFDLVALNDRVTVCDMTDVPLSDETVDIAVFCLSLMGKNLSDFLKEANRVLQTEGVLLVAEVSSRFDDVREFMTAMSQLGFKCVNKNTENSHFYLFEFSKVRPARDASKHPGLQLKPCLYKKR